jgi:hypothetical protein
MAARSLERMFNAAPRAASVLDPDRLDPSGMNFIERSTIVRESSSILAS